MSAVIQPRPCADGHLLDAGQFRRTVGHFPRSVTLISSGRVGAEHAVTASTFTVVSFPLRRVAVTLYRASRLVPIIRRSGGWGVSLLGEGDAPVARHFARTGRPLGELSDRFGCRRGPVTGVALFDGAMALMECRVVAELDADDHLIVIGEAVWTLVRDTAAAPLCDFHGILDAYPSRSVRD
jgi:flavin reductase